MPKKLQLAVLALATISFQTANAATVEVLPAKQTLQPTLQPTLPAIPVAQNRSPSNTYEKLPDFPEKLKVPAGNALILKTPAKGVQIYVCQPTANDSSKLEWTLKAPEATLLNETGAVIGKHYGGPTWEHQDGSKVVGEVKERVDSPDASAIPLLLLSAKSNQGNGLFSKVTYLQRVNTKGGKAPNTGCDSSKTNSTIRVDYTADYYYYSAQ
ncbi:MAG: DUF3455 domain-containing protein [Oscillatoriaceae cyanobacterium Prado104]|nr:DUF3455 domain-containing protein [Oscillatoriaceae cyanobacterium Prado104]